MLKGFSAGAQKTVLQVASGTAVLSAVMLLLLAVFKRLDLPAVLGVVLGAAAAVLNFILLAVTVSKAAGGDAGRARGVMGLSYSARMLLLGVIIFLMLRAPWINGLAGAAPLIFPRITIMFLRKRGGENVS